MADRPLQKLRRTFTRHKDVKAPQLSEPKRIGTIKTPVKVKQEAWSDESKLPSNPKARAAFSRLHYLRGELARFHQKKEELEVREDVLLSRLALSDLSEKERKEDEEAWAPDDELDALAEEDVDPDTAATATKEVDSGAPAAAASAASHVLSLVDAAGPISERRTQRAMSLETRSARSYPTTMRNKHSLSVRYHRRMTTRRRREAVASGMPARTLFLVRTKPGMPLGLTLKQLLVPCRDAKGRIVQPPQSRFATFVASVDDNGVADKAGVRVGDQVLEVDGVSCAEQGQENVMQHLNANEGTVTVVVRFASDYKRLMLHRKKIETEAALREQRKRLQQLQEQDAVLVETSRQKQKERAVLDVVSTWQQAPSASSSEDELIDREDGKLWLRQRLGDGVHLSEADVLSHCTCEDDYKQAILDLQQAWQAERLMFQGSRLILERRLQRVANGLNTLQDLESGTPPNVTKTASRTSLASQASRASSNRGSSQQLVFGIDLQKQEILTEPRATLVFGEGAEAAEAEGVNGCGNANTGKDKDKDKGKGDSKLGLGGLRSSSIVDDDDYCDADTEEAADGGDGVHGGSGARSSAGVSTSTGVSAVAGGDEDDAFMFEPAPAPPSDDDDQQSEFLISEIHHSEV